MAPPTDIRASTAARRAATRGFGGAVPHAAGRKVVTLPAAAEPEESLPYRVELWRTPEGGVERVLGDALSAGVAQAIYQEALREYPGRIVALRCGERIIARSAGPR
jgi:hypothetical protein